MSTHKRSHEEVFDKEHQPAPVAHIAVSSGHGWNASSDASIAGDVTMAETIGQSESKRARFPHNLWSLFHGSSSVTPDKTATSSTFSHPQLHTATTTEHVAPAVVMAPLDDVPKLLLGAMQSHDARIVEEALKELTELCANATGNSHGQVEDPNYKNKQAEKHRSQAFRMGAQLAVVHVMGKWRYCESIQTEACRCIVNLTWHHAELKTALAELGGVEAIVNAMRAFPSSTGIQHDGLGALGALFDNKDGTTPGSKALAHRFVLKMDGIALVVGTMYRFAQDAKIQEWGCDFFTSLCQFGELMEPMIKDGAAAAAGKSLKQHLGNKHVKDAVTKLMKHMFDSA